MPDPVSAVEQPPFPLDIAEVNRVRQALRDAVIRQREAQTNLYNAIGDCVHHVRGQGMSAEATLITLKAFIRHTAAASPFTGNGTDWLTERRMDGFVLFIITEYFRAPDG